MAAVMATADSDASPRSARAVALRRLRQVAVPPEHGATALAVTAALAGLAVAPQPAGVAQAAGFLLAISAGNAALLAAGPLPPVLRPWARGWLVAAGILAAVALVPALWLTWPVLLPMGFLSVGAVHARLRLGPGRGRRHPAVQLPGLAAIALGAALPGLAIAANPAAWTLGVGLALWSVLLTLAVRARLRRDGAAQAALSLATATALALSAIAQPWLLWAPLVAWGWARRPPQAPARLGVQAAVGSAVVALALVLAGAAA
jgi:hypothetical protein